MSLSHIRVAGPCLAVALALSGCGTSTGLDSPAAIKAEKAEGAQPTLSCDGFPRNDSNGAVTICELREFSDLATQGTVNIRESVAQSPPANVTVVQINPNPEQPTSDIRAQGAERSTVLLRAYVYATGADEADARATAAEVVIHTNNDDFYATGPDRRRGAVGGNSRRDWAVGFDAELPRNSNLNARTTDGALLAQDLIGELTVESTFGEIELNRISGSVLAGNSSGNIVARDLDGAQNLSNSLGEIVAERFSGSSIIANSSGLITAADLDGDSRLSNSTGDLMADRLSGASVLESSSGLITAADLDGDSRVTSSTGDVQLSRARGRIALDTSSGRLVAEDLDGETEFVSSSGDVKLSRVAGTLRGQTSGGNIELDLDGPTFNGSGAELSSSSGNITLLAPADYSAVFSFVTNSGNIRSDFSGNSFSGQARYSETVGAGGPTLSAETSSGDITLSRKQ